MKRLSILLLLLPLLAIGGDKIAIDIKVPLTETADLIPAQAGATLFLMRSDWALVTELGEDVAVWLTDYERKKNFIGQQVISLSMEIREPSSLRIGNLIEKERVTVRYWHSEKDSEKYNQQILNELDHTSKELKVEAYHLGKKIEASLEASLR